MVNIQGDEPLLEPEIIDQVVAALQATPDAVYRCMRWALSPACIYKSMQQHTRLLRSIDLLNRCTVAPAAQRARPSARMRCSCGSASSA